MTSLHHAPAHRPGLFTRAAEGIASVFGRMVANLRNRQAIANLSHLDDRTLDDMGIKRGDVQAVLRLPMTDDPSTHLSLLVGPRSGSNQPERRRF